MLGWLRTFKRKHGHVRLPPDDPQVEPLRHWLKLQHRYHLDGRLPAARRRSLTQLGVDLDLAGWDDEWESAFADLAAYRRRHGHVDGPFRTLHPRLSAWVTKQRRRQALGRLSPSRVARLEELGFAWDSQRRSRLAERRWDAQLAVWKEWKIAGPTGPPVSKWLKNWAATQRREFRDGTLRPERRRALKEAGFELDMGGAEARPAPRRRSGQRAPRRRSLIEERRRQAEWDACLERLGAFQERFGHTQVPRAWAEDAHLGNWVSKQREGRRDGNLLAERQARLEQLGFEWEGTRGPKSLTPEARLGQLRAFLHAHGHLLVPDQPPHDGLHRWLEDQRQARRRGAIDFGVESGLDKLGCPWTAADLAWEKNLADLVVFQVGRDALPGAHLPLGKWLAGVRLKLARGTLDTPRAERLRNAAERALDWEEQLDKLRAFHQRFGHCEVPSGWPEDPSLAVWVAGMRTGRTQQKLSADRRRMLTELGFTWARRDREWEINFGLLEGYRERFGHCNVPRFWDEDRQLGFWVQGQRTRHAEGRLAADRVARLEAIGFAWERTESHWREMLERLDAFRARHGHGNVPHTYRADPELAQWLVHKRQAQRTGKLAPERHRELVNRGVVFGLVEAKWEAGFAKLTAFKKEHGHALGPFGDDPQLLNWVTVQRQRKASGKLSRERTKRLNELGFGWVGQRGRRADEHDPIDELREFRLRHGHLDVPDREQHRRLFAWLAQQRAAGEAIDRKLQRRLDALHVPMLPQEVEWERMFARVREHALRRKGLDLSRERALGRWLADQRQRADDGDLDPYDARRLADLGLLDGIV